MRIIPCIFFVFWCRNPNWNYYFQTVVWRIVLYRNNLSELIFWCIFVFVTRTACACAFFFFLLNTVFSYRSVSRVLLVCVNKSRVRCSKEPAVSRNVYVSKRIVREHDLTVEHKPNSDDERRPIGQRGNVATERKTFRKRVNNPQDKNENIYSRRTFSQPLRGYYNNIFIHMRMLCAAIKLETLWNRRRNIRHGYLRFGLTGRVPFEINRIILEVIR